jgi:NCS1 family nucleobase:cation symporter-1
VSCFTTIRRSVLMRVIGSLLLIAIGTVCAVLGYREFVGNLSNFLTVLLYVFVPWSAINLTDYYVVRRGHYDIASFFTAAGRYGGFFWPGLVAYVVAVAAELPFVDQAFYTGPLVKVLNGVDISWVVGAGVGIVVYLVALRLPTRSAAAPIRPDAPAAPAADQPTSR